MNYKPYSLEWSRKRYLSESLQKYFDDGVETEIIIDDIIDCLVESNSFYKTRAEKIQSVIERIGGLGNESI